MLGIFCAWNGCADSFLADFLKPRFHNLLFSVRNSTVCLGQDLKQFSFWNYFLVVSCEEFAVAVNPFPSSYHLFFILLIVST